MEPAPNVAFLVVAAGRGARLGAGVPKQYLPLGGRPMLARTLSRLLRAAPAARARVVIHPDDAPSYAAALGGLPDALRTRLDAPAHGGATRQSSVRAGLEAMARDGGAEIVLIHDAARCFVDAPLVARAVDAARAHGAAVPAVRLQDAVARLQESGVGAFVDRESMRIVQTPQAFAFGAILDAHRAAARAGRDDFADDGAVAAYAGLRVAPFEGDAGNVKVTTPADYEAARARLLAAGDVRTGQGYDVHAFGPGDHVWLGGVRIAHDRGLVGHSDADVALHALCDALYGALGDGDIGAHFPPTDARWRGAASEVFLRHAAGRVAARGAAVTHVDVTIVCEAPKIGPRRDDIRAMIAATLGVAIDRVGVKATTSEGLGFVGRREGVWASAIATLRMPGEE
ncbi:MAG: bifunctional 2-C-methyl-D-erythritol 4-phosphate cytidylyltransferase/2-C-methyl-D-erythritol 2,4-cyclodiphosphate synthase [Hyphomicrobiales bacterium]|nr:bifunctional 2-C-methyl-D-erythritol 4-phosphate cytidylyltransferase/2-C-methyl-D-erythritol 2,4-cyclodiphosphate synthase [Hyphomicrobiales bacterium]